MLAAVRTEDGWSAEMAIPFKSFRDPERPPGVEHRWGFQITRVIRGKSEAQSWSPISRGVAGQLTQFGVLEGLSDLSRSRNLEILPELTGARLGAQGGFRGALRRVRDAITRAPDADDVIAAAAQAAADATDPVADRRGSVEYKRNMARVLTGRAIARALARAAGG